MTTAQDVVNYTNTLVGKKVTVPTNPYGGQCIALIDHIVQHFTDGNKDMANINAIDGLKKAKQNEFPVIENDPNDPYLIPQPGDIVITTEAWPFGHIFVVVSADTKGMHTIEQNIDGYRDDNGNGINDQLEVGGGGYTRKNYRDYSHVVGWFRLPYSSSQEAKKQREDKSTMEPKNVNGDLYSGLITGVDPNIMNANSDRVKIDRIVIHHNAGTNDENARRTWYVSTGIGTSAHYQVTPDKIWGCVGENFVAYHAGDYGMNQRSIGIEHLNSTGAPSWQIAEGTYHNSAQLIVDICQRYGIPIDRQHIIGHREVFATQCPGGIDLDKLIRLAKEYASGVVVSKTENTTQKPAISKTETTGSFKVRVSVTDLNIRKEPSLKAKTKGKVKPGVYTITEIKSADGYEWGKLKSGAGWIALKYAKRL